MACDSVQWKKEMARYLDDLNDSSLVAIIIYINKANRICHVQKDK